MKIHGTAKGGALNTKDFGVAFSGVAVSEFLTATGGTITVPPSEPNYKIHTFTSSGTFEVTAVGSVSDNNEVQYLVIAGGGGGGYDDYSGGSGAGGFRTATGFEVSVQTYTITVGDGGTGAQNGEDSIFSTITSDGGGYGSYSGVAGADGGSGGGGSSGAGAAGSGIAGQGYDGADGVGAPSYNSGGGGGANADAPAVGTGAAGTGGAGKANPISGSTSGVESGGVYYFCGGGGGGDGDTGGQSKGIGGLGGGGDGGQVSPLLNPTDGATNSGSGGGGLCRGSVRASGGSGIVILKYKFQ